MLYGLSPAVDVITRTVEIVTFHVVICSSLRSDRMSIRFNYNESTMGDRRCQRILDYDLTTDVSDLECFNRK